MSRSKKNPLHKLNRRLELERLEERALPTCNIISGYVYYDANNNGLYDMATEAPIANSSIELRNANGVVVGSTTTDALGYYEFDTDQANPGADTELTKIVALPTGPTQTNYTLKGLVDKFDSSLGQLQSIDIVYGGSITSKIDAENFSDQSESDISGTVSGNIKLTGPGVNDTLNITAPAGTPFHAGKYDGTTDYTGASGGTLGENTANGTKTVTLTGAAMNAYVGSGQVELTTATVATSSATGGGNLDVRVRSTGVSTIKVVYHYKAYECLAPGDYKIVQTQQPPGFTDGRESKDGAVIPNTVGTDFINVTLNGVDLVHNDFGELKLTQISGHVWYDENNDGIRGANEALIPGTTITLEGPGGPLTKLTDANGFYEFTGLQPGTYTVKETQPAGYIDGKDIVGTVNGVTRGTLANDEINTITLAAGDDSINNDFGEVKISSIAGHVWFDANNNGVREANELPIPGTTITLTGFSDSGPVSKSMQTNSLGEYKFENLRPGTYTLTETQPAGYADGQDNIGTPGGTEGNDVFSAINLPPGFDGVDNDFGEIKGDEPTPLPKVVNLQGMLPIISKNQLLNDATSVYLEPTIRGQMAFVVGTTITLTGQQLDLNGTLNAVQQVKTGGEQAFVNAVYASDAHRVQQANQLYQSILNRMPTAGEQAATVTELKNGADTLEAMENIYVSPAYQQLHPTTEALAAALSEDILNVVPGTAAVQNLVQSMANDPLSTVVHNLLYSDASLANQIDNTYRDTVRRAATSAEIQTWTPALKAGTVTLDDLARRLLASAEFYQLAYLTIN